MGLRRAGLDLHSSTHSTASLTQAVQKVAYDKGLMQGT